MEQPMRSDDIFTVWKFCLIAKTQKGPPDENQNPENHYSPYLPGVDCGGVCPGEDGATL
jgi:hypothetical protein